MQDAFRMTKQYFFLRKKQVGRLKAPTCFILWLRPIPQASVGVGIPDCLKKKKLPKGSMRPFPVPFLFMKNGNGRRLEFFCVLLFIFFWLLFFFKRKVTPRRRDTENRGTLHVQGGVLSVPLLLPTSSFPVETSQSRGEREACKPQPNSLSDSCNLLWPFMLREHERRRKICFFVFTA